MRRTTLRVSVRYEAPNVCCLHALAKISEGLKAKFVKFVVLRDGLVGSLLVVCVQLLPKGHTELQPLSHCFHASRGIECECERTLGPSSLDVSPEMEPRLNVKTFRVKKHRKDAYRQYGSFNIFIDSVEMTTLDVVCVAMRSRADNSSRCC